MRLKIQLAWQVLFALWNHLSMIFWYCRTMQKNCISRLYFLFLMFSMRQHLGSRCSSAMQPLSAPMPLWKLWFQTQFSHALLCSSSWQHERLHRQQVVCSSPCTVRRKLARHQPVSICRWAASHLTPNATGSSNPSKDLWWQVPQWQHACQLQPAQFLCEQQQAKLCKPSPLHTHLPNSPSLLEALNEDASKSRKVLAIKSSSNFDIQEAPWKTSTPEWKLDVLSIQYTFITRHQNIAPLRCLVTRDTKGASA